MKAELEERFDILRRSLDRAQEYFYNNKDSSGVDHVEHIRNELELLRKTLLTNI